MATKKETKDKKAPKKPTEAPKKSWGMMKKAAAEYHKKGGTVGEHLTRLWAEDKKKKR